MKTYFDEVLQCNVTVCKSTPIRYAKKNVPARCSSTRIITGERVTRDAGDWIPSRVIGSIRRKK